MRDFACAFNTKRAFAAASFSNSASFDDRFFKSGVRGDQSIGTSAGACEKNLSHRYFCKAT